MKFKQEEIIKAKEIFKDLRKDLGLPSVEVEISPYRPIHNEKADVDENGNITIYAQKIISFEDLVHTIRHELRHVWQQINYPEHTKWWRENMPYYNYLKSCSMLYKCYTVEADAEQFAIYNNTELEALLKRPTRWLEDKKTEFYHIYKTC